LCASSKGRANQKPNDWMMLYCVFVALMTIHTSGASVKIANSTQIVVSVTDVRRLTPSIRRGIASGALPRVIGSFPSAAR
jgi:hypothetical protein